MWEHIVCNSVVHLLSSLANHENKQKLPVTNQEDYNLCGCKVLIVVYSPILMLMDHAVWEYNTRPAIAQAALMLVDSLPMAQKLGNPIMTVVGHQTLSKQEDWWRRQFRNDHGLGQARLERDRRGQKGEDLGCSGMGCNPTPLLSLDQESPWSYASKSNGIGQKRPIVGQVRHGKVIKWFLLISSGSSGSHPPTPIACIVSAVSAALYHLAAGVRIGLPGW